MDLLFVATSSYGDSFAEEWSPDLRYTASYLRRRGIDAGFTYRALLNDAEALSTRVRAVYFELTEENRDPVLRCIERMPCRPGGPVVIVGGIPATVAGDALFAQCPRIDLLVVGERDETLLETAARLRTSSDLLGMAGLRTRDWCGPPRPLLANLDVLGNMIHDGLAESLCRRPAEQRTAFVVSSRGCYGYCSFCGVPDFYRHSSGRPWRGRSPRVVVDEIEDLAECFAIRQFVFQDDDFIGPGTKGQERARDIADEILRRGLTIRYFFCCRLNDVHPETMRYLQRSGLSGIGVSIESANQDSLRLLRKGLQAEAIYPTLALLEEMRMPCEINMIFFDPHLTLDGVRRNLEVLDYVRCSEYLSYSDAFPLNELKPFRWSRVAVALSAEGLVDEARETCHFRDPAVAALAALVRRLRASLPLTFKKRLLFDALETSADGDDAPTSAPLLHLSAGLRHWIGLVVMPHLISDACDMLESRGALTASDIESLEARLQRAIGALAA
jgi:hypothetical protein